MFKLIPTLALLAATATAHTAYVPLEAIGNDPSSVDGDEDIYVYSRMPQTAKDQFEKTLEDTPTTWEGLSGKRLPCDDKYNEDWSAVKTLEVAAGSDLGMFIYAGQSPYQRHPGPIMAYMAKVEGDLATQQTSELQWFKVWQSGAQLNVVDGKKEGYKAPCENNPEGLYKWELQCKNEFSIPIPQCIEGGNYVLYVVNYAMQLAGSQEDSVVQYWPTCSHLKVTGGGSFQPETISLPGGDAEPAQRHWPENFYDEDAFGENFEYPGPEPVVCGGASGSGSGSYPSNGTSTIDVRRIRSMQQRYRHA